MNDIIQYVLNDSQWPLLTVFLLGLLVAIHPCPLATNVAALGYISQAVREEGLSVKEVRGIILRNGLLYVLGRTLAYSILGAVLILLVRSGIQILHLGDQMSEWGERLLGSLLIIVGLYLLYVDLLHHHDHVPSSKYNRKRFSGIWGSLLLGIVFAMAFCPESGIVYFGMLIPMSVESSWGYLLPIVFAMGTGLPVLLMAWIIAYSMDAFTRLNRVMHIIQAWTSRVVAVLFIVAGIICLTL